MLRVSFNSVSDMDASLQLLPKLADLCLSDNCITHIDNLQHCTSLTRLVCVVGGWGGWCVCVVCVCGVGGWCYAGSDVVHVLLLVSPCCCCCMLFHMHHTYTSHTCTQHTHLPRINLTIPTPVRHAHAPPTSLSPHTHSPPTPPHKDMSSNRLRCVAGIAAVAPTLRALRLQGNALSSVQGVDSLMALEHLDLRDTLISSFQVGVGNRRCGGVAPNLTQNHQHHLPPHKKLQHPPHPPLRI